MSDENKESVTQEENSGANSEKEAFVPKDAYENVKNDMFKYKSKFKDMEAELNQLRADREAMERERMEEEGRWKELANKYKSEAEQVKSKYTDSQRKFIDFHKKNAVTAKVGFAKEEYAHKFINVEAIEADENGQINMDSVLAEVNRIKETYPELLKGDKVSNFNSAPAKKGEVPASNKELKGEAAHKDTLLGKLKF